MIRKKLEWYDVDNALQAVHTLRNTDGLVLHGNAVVTFIADDNWLSMTGCDLSKSILHLGVQGILCHNYYDGQALIDESKRPVLKFPSENTFSRINGRESGR
jgi:hypothetical protein